MFLPKNEADAYVTIEHGYILTHGICLYQIKNNNTNS